VVKNDLIQLKESSYRNNDLLEANFNTDKNLKSKREFHGGLVLVDLDAENLLLFESC